MIDLEDLSDGTTDVRVQRGPAEELVAVVNVPGTSDQIGKGIGAQLLPMVSMFGIKLKYVVKAK